MSLKWPAASPKGTGTQPLKRPRQSWLRRLLTSWDFYLIVFIVLVAGFLRFYQIGTTEFDEDQAMLFRLAYDAVHSGLLPVTSNRASIGLANPPGVIYLLMLPAALSSNPVWAAVLVGAFSVVAIALTYIFTQRYFGRGAAVIAALLYAVTFRPLIYARFIWQPNLMAPFVVFFMFALFRGAVERRKGWLFPALLLPGILYQMHEITLLLVIPLLAACVLAPRTLRWRDLVLAALCSLVIFFPFLLWEIMNRFRDMLSLLAPSGHRAVIDNQAWLFYRLFLLPYDQPPTYPGSVQAIAGNWLRWLHLHTLMPYLVLGGFLVAVVLLLLPWPLHERKTGSRRGDALCSPASPVEVPPGEHKASPLQHTPPSVGAQSGILTSLRAWWSDFSASPYRRSLLLLLCWQLIPLLILTRHSVDLHTQYFLLFLPGPYILVGLLIAKIGELFQHYQRSLPPLQWVRYALYLGMALVIIAQFVLSAAGLVDQVEGNYNDRSFQPYPYHNDLRSLQTALDDADALAGQHHLSRVYVTMDTATQTALGFLTEQMHPPTTLFDAGRCLLLPGRTTGPAVLLVGPYDTLTNILLSRFAHATLIEQSQRPGGAPFKLYIVDPAPVGATAQSVAAQPRFGHDLQLLNVQAHHLSVNNASWLVARWSLLRSAPSAPRTTYSYSIKVSPAGSSASIQSTCILSSLQAGDQVLSALSLPQGSTPPTTVDVSVQSFTTTPYNPTYGPLHLETYLSHYSPSVTLPAANGKTSITVPVSG